MRLPLVLTFCFVTLACGPSVPSYASSLFEGDDETWLISGNGDSTRPTFMATGGNGGNGNICATDALAGDIFYFVAPPKFLGNTSSVYGTRLTFDLKTSSQFMLLKGRDVVLNGGGLALIQNFKDVPGRDWSPRSFTLDDKSGWLVDSSTSTGEPATEEQVRTVLRNLTAIRLRGEFVDGPGDTTCLDNAYFGTP
ncbi:MAG: laminin B domain-containing protein [Myxococcales bacterium]|nr:laminin B domain-containing protein [Myxococcales bacterium]MDP3502613.1 laminin B domain-containing protein [Myxococcales bacterium]